MDFLYKVQQFSKGTQTDLITLDSAVVSGRNQIAVQTPDGAKSLDLSLSETGFRQFVNTLGVPLSYAKKMPSELADHTFNYLLNSKHFPTFRVVYKDNVVRGFMDSEYPYIDPALVLETLIDNLGSSVEFSACNITEEGMSGKLMTEAHKYDIGGSTYLGGVSFSYSDTWLKFPSLESYLNRLVCTNGATAPVTGKKFRVAKASPKVFLEQVVSFSTQAEDQIHQMMDGFIALQQIKVENAKAMIRQIARNYRLPKKIISILVEAAETNAFLATIPNNKITTMYDVINIFTWVGTHSSDVPEEYRQILCEIGGKQMIDNHDRCTSCGSSM